LKVEIFEDFLPLQFSKELIETYSQKKAADRTNKTSWDKEIVEHSNFVLVNDLTQEHRFKIVVALQKKDPQIDINKLVNANAMFYRWSLFSYIPPHNDHDSQLALTIYLNEDYHIKEGGVFMYKINEEDNWRVIEPKFNRAVLSKSKVLHWVTPITSNRDRMTIQFFA